MLKTHAPHEISNTRQHEKQENGKSTTKTCECPTCNYVGAEIRHLLKHRQTKPNVDNNGKRGSNRMGLPNTAM